MVSAESTVKPRPNSAIPVILRRKAKGTQRRLMPSPVFQLSSAKHARTCAPEKGMPRKRLHLITVMQGTRGWPVSRVLSTPDRDPGLDDHSSARPVARRVKLPTRASGLKVPCGGIPACARTSPREAPIRHCSGWGLPYRPGCPVRGGLLPHRFTVTAHAWPSLLCGAFPGVAPAGRYPAPLPHGVRTFLGTLPLRDHPAIRATRGVRGQGGRGQWGRLPMPRHRSKVCQPSATKGRAWSFCCEA